ncbi:MAG: carboxypeptidase regulatory-like domain-containing protein [Acidobacteriia bacterium]|nr:carboxypeptidase regulatory-like domain-containing protein [Terriglobia bacterium]
MRRWSRGHVALAAFMVCFLCGWAFAQELTTGIVEGVVKDDKGRPVEGAAISVDGPQGHHTAVSDADGRFSVRSLPAGTYLVKAEAHGFGTVVQSGVQVNINKRTQVPFKLSGGRVETVTVTSEAPIVDMKNTSVGATISVSSMVDYIPLGRNFSAMFTLSPGVVSGLNSGAGNYSISGSSGLENSYLVDGVNITNSGYGGIGSYNRRYGSLGSGVTNDFIDQVEVKEAGFEAEFGQATGGVVNAVVKSGTNNLSGQVAIYSQPTSFESERKLVYTFPDAVPIKDRQQQDIGLSLGGPILKDRLFWFAAYNPVETKTTFERTGLDPTALYAIVDGEKVYYDPAQTSFGRTAVRTRDNDNYAAKFSWYMTPNHRFEVTAFGDPSTGKLGPQLGTAIRRVGEQGFSKLDYGGNNVSLKYAGAITSNFFVDGLVARHKSKLKEQAQELFELENLDIPGGLVSGGLGFTPDTDENVDQYALKLTYVIGNHEIKGGWQQDKVEYTEAGKETGPTFTQNLPIGVFDDASGKYVWSGEYYQQPSTTGAFLTFEQTTLPDESTVPVYTVQRSRTSPLGVLTHNTEDNFFLQDTWSITPRWTLKVGVRHTKENVSGGAPFALPFSFISRNTTVSRARLVDPNTPTPENPEAVTFPQEWAPRVGVTWDVRGDGRHKVYANYSKMVQRLTQDLAYRAFSNEVDMSQRWLDANLTQPAATSNCPVAGGGTALCQAVLTVTGSSPTQVWSGTKLPYTEEMLLGYSRELSANMSVDLRYIHRRIGRIIEDFSYVPQEEIDNLYWGSEAIPGATFNPYPSYLSNDFGNYVLGNPSQNSGSAIAQLGGPGFPDFPKPRRDYDAFEVIFNKRFSDNWVMWASYRYGQLIGNYEGLLRNDNGQDDPNITSLYDFPDSPLMHGQFIAGPLNTDVKHNLKVFATYQFKNGLSMGAALTWSTGVPRFPQLVHPNDFYQLPGVGEVPGTDPVYGSWLQRMNLVPVPGFPGQYTEAAVGAPFLVLSNGIGALPSQMSTGQAQNGQLVFTPYNPPSATTGQVDEVITNPLTGNNQFLYSYATVKRDFSGRTPDSTTIDFHVSYNLKTHWKNSNINLGLDVFNLFNTQEGDTWDDVLELSQATRNPNYGRADTYAAPRSARVSLRWSF